MKSALDITDRTAGSVVVLDMAGQLVAGDGDARLKDRVNSLILEGHRRLLLNLAGVNRIDSCGLGELAASHHRVTRHGGQIKLLHLTKRVHDLLVICRLETVFDVYDSEDEAVRSFDGRE